MQPSDTTIEQLVAEQQERPLPRIVPREVPLPTVAGKADAVIGMRRSGKTYRLFGEMHALLRSGVQRTRILYLNLEDAPEDKAVGIEKLLADWDDTISLTPEDNDRATRRDAS